MPPDPAPFWALATLTFILQPSTPRNAVDVPDRNPALQALDLLLPIVNFGYDDAWKTDRGNQICRSPVGTVWLGADRRGSRRADPHLQPLGVRKRAHIDRSGRRDRAVSGVGVREHHDH
ncbi:hypothetical protein Pme01_34340 [Planosporangium mesophilum]|uniref:Uncharacterized protein n=1 Tax=Planosporangium mesophilum TaxID=689768 RepID=A0A8J3TDF7_9ACTN|nr:hypothetical protein Pme01_34340 [Planosporangium mesophilum]